MNNTTPTNSSGIDDKKYPLDPTTTGMLVFAYVTILIASTVGNSSVILVIYRRYRSKALKNYYVLIFNLSLADLITAWFKIPPEISLLTANKSLLTSTPMCRIYYLLINSTYYTSVFTLVAISLQRYRAIIHPLSLQIGVKGTYYLCLLIWILSMAIRIPFLHSLHAVFYQNQMLCRYNLTKNIIQLSTIILIIVSFILPFAIVAFAYVRIARRVTRRKINSSKSAEKKEAETRKIIRMLIFATTAFAACVAPFQIFGLMRVFIDLRYVPHIREIATAVQVIAMCHSAVNPIAYTLGNDLFRKELKQAFSCDDDNGSYNTRYTEATTFRSNFKKTTKM